MQSELSESGAMAALENITQAKPLACCLLRDLDISQKTNKQPLNEPRYSHGRLATRGDVLRLLPLPPTRGRQLSGARSCNTGVATKARLLKAYAEKTQLQCEGNFHTREE